MVFLWIVLFSTSLIALPHTVSAPSTKVVEKVLKNNQDPLSHITITSKRATCTKDALTKGGAILTYADTVCVTFADGSQVKTDELTLELQTQSFSAKKGQPKFQKALPVKTMHCAGHVCIISKNRTAKADKATCNLTTGNCTLQGSVTLEQKAEKGSDVSLNTAGSELFINLKTDEINLKSSGVGSVSTVIDFGQSKALIKKSSSKAANNVHNQPKPLLVAHNSAPKKFKKFYKKTSPGQLKSA